MTVAREFHLPISVVLDMTVPEFSLHLEYLEIINRGD